MLFFTLSERTLGRPVLCFSLLHGEQSDSMWALKVLPALDIPN